MNLRVRRAAAPDAEVIARYNAAMAIETEHLDLERERLLAGVRAVLADAGKGFYLVAETEGAVAGQMMITYEWSDWRNGWFWWIQSVYVIAEYRRRGVFRTLFEHVQTAARKDPEVIGLRLYVERGNLSAQKTYRMLGMADTGYFVLEKYPL